MNKASQKGSTIVVVMVVVILLTIIGAMAMRGSVFGLKIATNSQANNIMDQNNDASFYYIENLDFIKSQLVGTGLFGFPKMADNRNKELVLCYRGGSTKFYQLGKVSLVYSELEGGSEKLKKEHIGGSSNMGFCQVDSSKSDFVSGRGAAMTQIAVRISGYSEDEPFAHYQIGTDAETGKLEDTLRVVVTSTTVMPVLSSATDTTINNCMQNLSYIDDPDSDLPTVSECLSSESIPFKTQVAEYNLGQFIKKYVAPPSA
ncbi:hypothetical protein F7P75_02120 [Acinetobacter gandensis]|uniref:Pilus assembly protein PilX n=1 Tax=Acinetobacter gandensis TaxID=1443941 RepID=A0A1A7RB23_9GAMM|nr:PilX N-terminal domain-containing pilus assembly protein [Acinetobacter gandensis]KAB0629176.1 hypothetical protein F7P75_02120 [Acinetobacter gandensis]OBX29126.1 hypothetical protein A9J31_02215 [Acinetobacter gandensis]